MYDFDVIKSQFELRGEVQRVLGAPIKTLRAYDIYPCPFHAEKTTGAFQVYDDRYKCWSCGEHGDVLDFIAWAENKSLTELLRENKVSMSPDEIKARQTEIIQKREVAREREEHLLQFARENLQKTEKWLEYYGNLDNYYRQVWRNRGVPDHFQDFWLLGACDDFAYKSGDFLAHSKTLTIPVRAVGGDVMTIRHRILSPIDGQKYRPDKSGLGAYPFLCDIDNKHAENIILTEGEIKAMVTFATLDQRGLQVVGIPSKSMMIESVLRLRGRKNAVVIPDPDGVDDIMPAAHEAGVRVLELPEKVDDWILANEITQRELSDIIRQARYA